MLVIDTNVGITDVDADIIKPLRRSKRPVILAASKVNSPMQEPDATVLWGLGLDEPYPISTLHGRRVGDLLDAVLTTLPKRSVVMAVLSEGPRWVALLGRPNIGRSSFLNRLAGSERIVVDPIAGTACDPIDGAVELGGQTWIFIDTADIRRCVHQTKGAGSYASLHMRGALGKTEPALVLIDTSEPLTK